MQGGRDGGEARWHSSHPGLFPRVWTFTLPGLRTDRRKSGSLSRTNVSAREKGGWQMKKIFAIFLAWMLVLPGFAAAADTLALPPEHASCKLTLPLYQYNQLTQHTSQP